ncbi:enoyl-CoA hydratase-related protein [Sporichthya sp.]|uniref:enoyl-CoA hydratase-related protein n=1 Tax=Sporichthya sp. TaxID=65475 RepID=UPI001800A67E|nr:enoyl-CoA hydratase-related protein [Sporichthya sp.]MBA3744383.1 enoyl-CoA hydratase/isomerase family protein [Sporichthya sp.]
MSVSLQLDGTVAIITLDDAGTRNALTGETAEAFLDAVASVQANPDVAALILGGANGAFCSGAARPLLAAARENPTDPAVMAALGKVYQCFVAAGTVDVPVIACMRGAAVGAGVNLALAADVRIVSHETRLLSGFLKIGLHPGGGHFMLLDRITGPQTSVAMTLLGEEVVGQKLVDLGLAWEALPDDEVDARGLELAKRCTDPELVRMATATFRGQAASRQVPWQTALRAEQAAQMWSMGRPKP